MTTETTGGEYWRCSACGMSIPYGASHSCGPRWSGYYEPWYSGWHNTWLGDTNPAILERIAKALEEIAHPAEKAEEQSNDWAGEAARLVMVELTDFHALNIEAVGPQYSNRQDAIVRALKKVILSTYKRAHDGR